MVGKLNKGCNIFFFPQTPFYSLSFKQRPVELDINFENNKFPFTLMATSCKKVLKNLNMKFKHKLFKYRMNNCNEMYLFLALFTKLSIGTKVTVITKN